MHKICIGDTLLIKQTSTIPSTPWGYRLVHIDTNTTIISASGITANYALVTLSDGIYGDYAGKMLLLEILDNSGIVIEQDELLISGIYCKYESLRLLAGLLGENITKLAATAGDWQDGYLRRQTVTLYTSSGLATELESYEFTQTFVTDFIPDARYHVQKKTQKAT